VIKRNIVLLLHTLIMKTKTEPLSDISQAEHRRSVWRFYMLHPGSLELVVA